MNNTIKFFRIKKIPDKEIRKAYLIAETETEMEKIESLGFIGKVSDFLSIGIISVEDVEEEAEKDKYLSITKEGLVIDVSDTLQEAAEKFKLWYFA